MCIAKFIVEVPYLTLWWISRLEFYFQLRQNDGVVIAIEKDKNNNKESARKCKCKQKPKMWYCPHVALYDIDDNRYGIYARERVGV